jgi:NAD(P)-dependent dehydrogenase (short-subunit alcohol dehydrogenase family)
MLMADEGARVVVHHSDGSAKPGEENPSSPEGVVREIRNRGGDAAACAASVVSWQGSHGLVEAAVSHFGRLDILVNNLSDADDFPKRMIVDVRPEEWDSIQRNWMKASFLCIRAALPCMRKQKQGRLIHVLSAEAVIGAVGRTHHGAAQMAVAGLSRNAAIEVDRYNVTSNCVVRCSKPGSDSDPAEAAPLAVFLASDAARGLSGQMFGVRGKEIFLFSQSRIQRSMHNSQGWTVERLFETFESTMRPHFTPLESSDAYFSWDSAS